MGDPVIVGSLKIEESSPFFVIAGPCVIENEDVTLRVASFLKEASEKLDIPVIPVPGLPSNKRKRGWDHIEEITKILKKKYKIKIHYCLGRKHSRPQKALNCEGRIINIKDSIFIKNKNLTENKAVLLLDDIITTGATLDECARILKETHIREVYALTIAMD